MQRRITTTYLPPALLGLKRLGEPLHRRGEFVDRALVVAQLRLMLAAALLFKSLFCGLARLELRAQRLGLPADALERFK